MTTSFTDLPLRDQNRARTRVALVNALADRLHDRQLEDISVAELCREAGVSQGTFFNHFPSKADLLTRFIQHWSLQVVVIARQARAEHKSALAAIEALFAATGQATAASPGLMLETIAHQARMPAELHLEPVEHAERLLLLPEVEDVMSLPDTGLQGILPVLLAQAIDQGELPASADVRTLTLALASVFFGVPLVMGRRMPNLITPLYLRQLQLIWAGARGL
ncbi:MAG: TetR/AcrR family transcriptional regulator [Alphaproteobacteria bacterium]|nr:TetR/AcrR family transcriptional regulator [Alphaproteobacteria bacterium]